MANMRNIVNLGYLSIETDEEAKTLTVKRTTPEGTSTEIFVFVSREFKRETCFCCTCPDQGNTDPYCRNHGWVGERTCEEHKISGDDFVYDPVTEKYTETKLLTVQEYRQLKEAAPTSATKNSR